MILSMGTLYAATVKTFRTLQVICSSIHFHTISMMSRLLNEFLARPPVLMHRHEMESTFTLFCTCKRLMDDLLFL